MPNTFKTLDLSTIHLPPRLRKSLSGEDGVIAYRKESDDYWYGWWMWVPEDPDEHNGDYDDFPEEIAVVQRYARDNDCDWVMFDIDAGIDPDLPTFDDE